MLWACLRFPHLALDALGIDANKPAHAVIDGPLQRRCIAFANRAAARAGVRAGLAVAAAYVLCPDLLVSPRDEAAERQALESLASLAYRYSAAVYPAAPDALFVEVGASLNLFGGWAALDRHLRRDLADAGFACTLAAAPTAAAAHVLAIHADGIAIPSFGPLADALGNVPIALGGLDEKIIAALTSMGLRDLRDLFHLPRAELTRRIGQDAIEHLDRMRGLAAETLPRWHPPARFERRIEFSYGVESQLALAFPLKRLLREFALFLHARDGGVQRFDLLLGHERGAATRIPIGLLAPQRDADSLFELARVRLERLELAAPVHALTLSADDLPPFCPLHGDLFDEGHREQLEWPALVERLRARLGDTALQGLRCVADHRPARAWRFAPVDTGRRDESKLSARKSDRVAEAPATQAPAARAGTDRNRQIRPFWLLRRPQMLAGEPARILAGPERIESGWWDEHDQRRDYYIVETRLGQRAWVFTKAGETAGWTLHGWFA